MLQVGALLLLAPLLQSCATARATGPCTQVRVAVLTPVDTVPVRDASVWQPGGREGLLAGLRADLADRLGLTGLTACEDDGEGDISDPASTTARGRADGVDVLVTTELVAFGQIRRSWLWLLAGQGLLAGIGHGVAAAAVTGRAATGWWVGLGEFGLEIVTWVGGALFASRWLDPVVVRCRAVRAADGTILGSWTVEATRPARQWLSRDPRPRSERLRDVADHAFTKVARKIAARCCSVATAPPALPRGADHAPLGLAPVPPSALPVDSCLGQERPMVGGGR